MNNALQKNPEWYAQRVGVITASRAGAILNLSPYKKPDDVMREMVREAFGAEREFIGNEATQYGEAHESDAIREYEEATGAFVESVGFALHPEHIWLGASLDGIAHMPDGSKRVIEVKCPFRGKYKSLDEKPEYHAQVEIQMAVSGIDVADFVVWREGEPLCIGTYGTDPRRQEWIEKLKKFHDEYVQIVMSPDLSAQYLGEAEPLREDAEWFEASQDYLCALVKKELAEKELEEKRSALLDLAGGKSAKGCGVQVIVAERKGNIDYKKIPELKGLDLEQYRGATTKTTTVKVMA